jgi:hypothetical protein
VLQLLLCYNFIISNTNNNTIEAAAATATDATAMERRGH